MGLWLLSWGCCGSLRGWARWGALWVLPLGRWVGSWLAGGVGSHFRLGCLLGVGESGVPGPVCLGPALSPGLGLACPEDGGVFLRARSHGPDGVDPGAMGLTVPLVWGPGVHPGNTVGGRGLDGPIVWGAWWFQIQGGRLTSCRALGHRECGGWCCPCRRACRRGGPVSFPECDPGGAGRCGLCVLAAPRGASACPLGSVGPNSLLPGGIGIAGSNTGASREAGTLGPS